MEMILKGNFIDAEDAEQLLKGISRLLKCNIYSGVFRPDTANCVMWIAIEKGMPIDEAFSAYGIMQKMKTWVETE